MVGRGKGRNLYERTERHLENQIASRVLYAVEFYSTSMKSLSWNPAELMAILIEERNKEKSKSQKHSVEPLDSGEKNGPIYLTPPRKRVDVAPAASSLCRVSNVRLTVDS
jgi:hypothetical protein